MKVNTDGVLLGAWVDIENSRQILDVGTGTGVIAIMLATRNLGSLVYGVESDIGSFQDAEANRMNSNYSSRLKFYNMPFQRFSKCFNFKYDHIVSNPPYFTVGTVSSNDRKANSRHTKNLSFEELISCSLNLLTTSGKLSVIIPNIEGELLINEAKKQGLYIQKKCYVYIKENKLGRYLLTFSREKRPYSIEHLTIRLSDGSYSPEYIDLTKDFYLNF